MSDFPCLFESTVLIGFDYNSRGAYALPEVSRCGHSYQSTGVLQGVVPLHEAVGRGQSEPFGHMCRA
jgi:hypothetical protein